MDVIGTAKMRRAVLALPLSLTLAGGSWRACAAQAVVPVAATGGTGPRGVPSDARILKLNSPVCSGAPEKYPNLESWMPGGKLPEASA